METAEELVKRINELRAENATLQIKLAELEKIKAASPEPLPAVEKKAESIKEQILENNKKEFSFWDLFPF